MRNPRKRLIQTVAVTGAVVAATLGTVGVASAATPPPGCTLQGSYATLFCKPAYTAPTAGGSGGPSAKQILTCTAGLAWGFRSGDARAAALGCGWDILVPDF